MPLFPRRPDRDPDRPDRPDRRDDRHEKRIEKKKLRAQILKYVFFSLLCVVVLVVIFKFF